MNPNAPETGSAAHGSETSSDRNHRKVARGTVTSNRMQKTLVVQVDRKVKHPSYEKFISRRTKLYVHDENSTARVGDIVEVVQTRPLSKLKRWRLVRVIQATK